MYLLVQLHLKPYKKPMDDFLAIGCSFSLLMIFICSIIFKYAALTDTEAIQQQMSKEQKDDFVVSQVTAPHSSSGRASSPAVSSPPTVSPPTVSPP